MQQRIAQQRGRGRRNPAGLVGQQARTAHWQHFAPGHVVGQATRPDAVAEADCRVQVGLGKIVALRMRHEFQRDLRIARKELRQARYQPLGAQRRHAGDMQHAAAALAGHQLDRGCLQFVQARADALEVALPRGGQHQALAHTLEQLHAEVGLQAAHLLAHRALRHMQFARGHGKTVVAGGGLEGL
ncbi:hypothetical protein D3C72_1615250 [compost metagenome]